MSDALINRRRIRTANVIDDYNCESLGILISFSLPLTVKDPKNFNHKQIMGKVKKLQDHQALYQATNIILPNLRLSNQNINY